MFFGKHLKMPESAKVLVKLRLNQPMNVSKMPKFFVIYYLIEISWIHLFPLTLTITIMVQSINLTHLVPKEFVMSIFETIETVIVLAPVGYGVLCPM